MVRMKSHGLVAWVSHLTKMNKFLSSPMETTEHADPTLELTLDTVKQRAVKSVAFLTGRTFIVQLITLLSTFLLTIFLNPSEYGVFFIVSAFVNFFAYFSDIGLAAALIQKKEKLSDEELGTTFTIQQSLVLLLIAIILLAAPYFINLYNLSNTSLYLIWALAISLFLSSLKTIPSVLLERRLEFQKLVIPQIVETLLYNIVAVYLAWRGFGIISFAAAVLVRGVSGLIIIYILKPWRPNITFSKHSLHTLLRFGLPYQANTFLAVMKDDGMSAVLGLILGPSGVGLLGWAQKWAAAPLRFFMDQVIKVTFPAYARMQDERGELSKAVSRSIFFICVLIFPSLVGLVIVAPSLVELIPRYEKWQPALLALTLISFNSAWAAITTPITNLFNAVGKVTLTFKFMVMWTVLTWILLPTLSYYFGVNGAGIAFALIGLSSIVPLYFSQKFVDINFWESVGKPLVASLIMGAGIAVLSSLLPLSYLSVSIMIILGLIFYFGALYALKGQTLIIEGRMVLSLVRKRNG